MPAVVLTRTIAATPDVVFEVLTDHVGYQRITPLRAVEIERLGDSEPNGVGAVRIMYPLGKRLPGARERVVEYDAPRRFAYEIVSGLPARSIQGEVDLVAVPEGTRMTYRHEIVPSVPMPAPVVRAMSRVAIGTLIRGITRESQRRS